MDRKNNGRDYNNFAWLLTNELGYKVATVCPEGRLEGTTKPVEKETLNPQ